MYALPKSVNNAHGDQQPTYLLKNKTNHQFPIIGIDLGVSYWSAAVVQDDQVLVIPFSGNNNIPAFVAHLKNEFKFGNDAKHAFFANQEVTIFDIIYILGLHFNAGGELEEHMSNYSYAISNFNDRPKLSFMNKKSNISLEELFDLIIRNLIYTSEVFLNKTVHNIVVPIPVYFKESQKSALLRATTRVGIIELILEPVAAAYAYKIHEKHKDDPKNRYFFIYNLQEDNLDVTVLQLTNNKFTIKSNIYKRHLKRNFLFRYLDELCTQTYEAYYNSNPRFHPLNAGTLRYYCKTIFEDILEADCFKIEMDTVRKNKIVCKISRADLDDLLRVLVQESLVYAKNVIYEAKLEIRDIDEVLLVGKVTRHDIVRQELKYLFGRDCLNRTLNPEDVLVIGAALRADFFQREIWNNAIPVSIQKANVYYTVSDASIIDSGDLLEESEFNYSYNEGDQQNPEIKSISREYAGPSICFEAEEVDEKLNPKPKLQEELTKTDIIKNELIKNDLITIDPIKTDITKTDVTKTDVTKTDNFKFGLKDKMLNFFTEVVNGRNVKMSVQEKLFLAPIFLGNKLINPSKYINQINHEKNFNGYNQRLPYKNPTENISSKYKGICLKKLNELQGQEITMIGQKSSTHIQNPIKPTNAVIIEDKNAILDADRQAKSKYLEKCKSITEYSTLGSVFGSDISLDLSSDLSPDLILNIENVSKKVGYKEKRRWSLKDKVDCIQDHLDMFYVTVCIVVFILHWASENICVNFVIAFIFIAITQILRNRASIQKIAKN